MFESEKNLQPCDYLGARLPGEHGTSRVLLDRLWFKVLPQLPTLEDLVEWCESKKLRAWPFERNNFLQLALRMQPKEYRLGSIYGDAPDEVNCSIFIKKIYQWMGIELPGYSLTQAQLGEKVHCNLLAGDLMFFKGMNPWKIQLGEVKDIGHVAMVINSQQIIHAVNGDIGTSIEPITDKLLKDAVIIQRVVPANFEGLVVDIPAEYGIIYPEDVLMLCLRRST